MKPQETETAPAFTQRALCGAIQSLLEVAKGVEEICAKLESASQGEDLQEVLGATAFASSNLEAVAKIVEKTAKTLATLRQSVKAKTRPKV